MTKMLILALGLIFSAHTAHAQLDELAQRAGLSGSGLSESKVASGLKEALRVGTTNACKSPASPTVIFGNEAIKILMPQRPPAAGAWPACRRVRPQDRRVHSQHEPLRGSRRSSGQKDFRRRHSGDEFR